MYFIHHHSSSSNESNAHPPSFGFPFAVKSIQKYLEIVSDLYVEPTNEEIIGSFLIPNEGSGRTNRVNSKQPGPSRK